MKKTLIIFLSIISVIATAQNPSEKLNSIISEYENNQRNSFGNRQIDSLGTGILGDFSLESYQKRYNFYKSLLAKLKEVDASKLTRSEYINLELLKFVIEEQTNNFEFDAHLNPLLADAGFHMSYAGMMRNASPQNLQDYKRHIQRLRDFPRYAQQYIDLMRLGIKKGIVQAQVIFDGYDTTYKPYIVDSPEKSEFYKPFTKFPSSIDAATQQKLITEGKAAIMESSRGFKLFSDFMDKKYLPAARKKEGISNCTNGKAYYEMLVRYYSTMQMTVEEVHKKGLEEVARIRREMEEVKTQTGFKGDFKEFLHFLRTDPQFYAKTPLELMKEASYIAKQVDGKLPAYFGKLPRQSYGVEPVPDAIAPKYTGGRYSPASPESHRAGHYWVNTYNLPSRPLYNLEALTLHEAVPGHHLQMALNYELENVPNFRKRLYLSAYGEGWALYTEHLGEEMGFYKNPYSKFGKLTYEMWRACRLVVDTGIHAYGWNRQQSIDYLANNTALSIHECTTETDRYISWPGQALSYKIGELKIRELRKKAESELNAKFNIREFHDAILSEGTVTLPLLEKIIEDYIKFRK